MQPIARQYLELVIKPVLAGMGVPGRAREQLQLGTAAQESGFAAIAQIASPPDALAWKYGPALGPWQMEPATYDDIVTNTLPGLARSRPDVVAYLHSITPRQYAGYPPAELLVTDLRLACAMAAIAYLRAPAPLPPENDVAAQAAYYKRFYNTPAGAGTVEQYIENWRRYCT